MRHAILWALPVAIGALAVALLHAHLYGSPFRSGYGAGDELYSFANVATNTSRYANWLAGTEAVWLLVAAPWAFARRRPPSPPSDSVAAWPLLAVAVLTMASYLAYAVFDDWWYTRFLLPAFPSALVLAALGLTHLLHHRGRLVVAFTIALVTGLVAWQTRVTIQTRDVLTLRSLEERYVLAGALVADRGPSPLVLAAQHSGSLRVHGGVDTLRWDLLSPFELDRALAFLQAHGRRPLIVVDGPEEPLFRARFSAHSAIGRLDWPPAAAAHTRIAVRLYDPADRAVYLAGGRVDTRHVFPERR